MKNREDFYFSDFYRLYLAAVAKFGINSKEVEQVAYYDRVAFTSYFREAYERAYSVVYPLVYDEDMVF